MILEPQVHRVLLVHRVYKAFRVLLVQPDRKVQILQYQVQRVHQEPPERLVHWVRKARLVLKAQLEHKVRLEHKAYKVYQVRKAHRVTKELKAK